MEQYLFEFPDAETAAAVIAQAEAVGAKAQWIAVENSAYEDEYAFVTEAVWPAVADSVSEAVAEWQGDCDGNAATVWPQPPFSEWTAAQKRKLIGVVVRRIGYCGPNGPDPEAIVALWQRGELEP